MKQKSLSELVYTELKECSTLKPSTAEAFRKLLEFLENKKPISKYLLNKFTLLGIYDAKENVLNCEPTIYDIVLKAMLYDGLLQAKCPSGKIRSLENYKEQKILSRLLVSKKQADKIRQQTVQGVGQVESR